MRTGTALFHFTLGPDTVMALQPALPHKMHGQTVPFSPHLVVFFDTQVIVSLLDCLGQCLLQHCVGLSLTGLSNMNTACDRCGSPGF